MSRKNLRPDTERAARAEAARQRRLRRTHQIIGRHDRVPAERIRQMLWAAEAFGLPLGVIAAEAGVRDTGTLTRIMLPEREWLRANTERAIRTGIERAAARYARGEVSENRVLVDECRTLVRRLGAAGWVPAKILTERGLPENIWRDRARYIDSESVKGVRAMYAELEALPGPSLAAARYWRERGYLIPAAAKPKDQLPLPPRTREVAAARKAEREARNCQGSVV